MNVAFRVDASLQIGTGHVMRCLTLADALTAKGVACYFISKRHPGHLFNLIIQRGHKLLPIEHKCPNTVPTTQTLKCQLRGYALWLGSDWEQDAEQTAVALASLTVMDWLVVDHYGIEANWEGALAAHYRQLMVIDDLADRPHRCDLLLDQTFGRQSTSYAPWVSARCTLLLGAQYALLRPEFATMRRYSISRRVSPQVRRLLVAMGGVDKDNVTGLVLKTLKGCDLAEDIEITVIMGPHAPWLTEVMQIATTLRCKTSVLTNVSDMATLMATADLAIGAAGATSWERCCLGLPSIIVVLADNQRHIAQVLKAELAVDVVSNLAALPVILPALINRYRMCPAALSDMSHAAARITDGRGVQKVLNHMGY
ncbi:UDP-2,4-diacetamido-2,4,6-trideoxy-beta-L-altropyranose hydrolase [Eoetvoesiella caeni]|uniref:UDP-2,4-diacetamido-2,4, 6-trideoxy-beta-L-altropyranose hydrolase n=1 Tax=Eoetvoesiella caeni TaxID=645616 RepID=A0A366HGJ5_9BURK|nr:UDP-2,4-diacetamido-2,4,6-trideoxy-beta-L-altropyranose hydrolase [Eoetvoesiella caeni]MCI2807803.1 UDP-2,4-diacetamido-2,4,6-trideoxy-beta-L-altropyranose hydrolase [Eoetvoesiella caeni]NYT54194.1 UDP-2,4-diacetamido-2,4,6-trideoxy-beta-L-altropyranose hydrolase [Eoetvoesiella caeni]RBP41719.1 UDP-2,4-diacetamido-2,4,6-trideoxy-beta-L-altropyranose hydrolase [Eoetvoesiella caeni]